jgi:5-methylcytosine-specific restriction endonuclease McrA
MHNRKARERANGGILSVGLAEKLFELQKGKCACCGQPLGEKYHMDHILPIVLGGPNEDWNIQLLRQRCNQQKHAKHPVDFMQSRGFLL